MNVVMNELVQIKVSQAYVQGEEVEGEEWEEAEREEGHNLCDSRKCKATILLASIKFLVIHPLFHPWPPLLHLLASPYHDCRATCMQHFSSTHP